MIQKGFQNVIESLWFMFFLILVWAGVMGMANPPSWNSFVAYYNSYSSSMFQGLTISEFFGQAMPILTKTIMIDPVAISRLQTGQGGVTDVFSAVMFGLNLLTGGFISIVVGIGVLIWFLMFFFSTILPLVTAFAYFFAGSFVTNDLPGIVGRINWQSLQEAMPNGYPDPVVSSSFFIVG